MPPARKHWFPGIAKRVKGYDEIISLRVEMSVVEEAASENITESARILFVVHRPAQAFRASPVFSSRRVAFSNGRPEPVVLQRGLLLRDFLRPGCGGCSFSLSFVNSRGRLTSSRLRELPSL